MANLRAPTSWLTEVLGTCVLSMLLLLSVTLLFVVCRFVPVTGGLDIQFIFRGHNFVEKEIFSWTHMGSDIIPVKYMMIHHSGAEAVAGNHQLAKQILPIQFMPHANILRATFSGRL